MDRRIAAGGRYADITLHLLVEGAAELLVKFTKPATREHPFKYHCHVLEHEDAGMMGQYTCT